jgi:hypothetical protein
MTILEQLQAELTSLRKSYVRQLEGIKERADAGIENATKRSLFSTHTPFNLSSECQELQTIASKIEQTRAIITAIEVL